MHFYKVSFSGLNLSALTYHSDKKIENFTAVKVNLNRKENTGYVVSQCDEPDFKTLEILEILPYSLTKMQAELVKFISYYYTCNFGVAIGLCEENTTKDTQNFTQNFNKTPTLNEKQNSALNFIKSHKTSLLFGDTGSGKSEVYIAAIKEILDNGEQALFLMPEISLTPQMQKRLEGFFGEAVAIWHSKISAKKKGEILENIANGKVLLVAGARSALFLPMSNLKLIVVDEEHDDSYKNTGSRPHYNARDLVLFLSSKFDVRVILGSATPSLTSFHKQPVFRMRGTFFNSQKFFIYDESETGLTQILKDEIAKCLANKKQAVICLPTRANFKYLECKECGESIKCPFCSIGMSFYKKQNVLKCQYCEYKMPVTQRCEKCGSQMIEAKKIGTSELLEQLQNEFANARISKFDRDEITTQNKLVKALKEFNDGKIDILVGTQMLSKGHDYHNVDLAVIMGIDELLNYPDFRAREKTLALSMQVAGRAGRNGIGRVIVQSRQREFFENYISDYDKFLADELSFRESLYPPFTRLLRIIISHKNEASTKKIMDEMILRINSLQNDQEFQVIGYGKCAIERLGDKFRYEILIRSSSHLPLINIANICNQEHADIDIDPVNFS
ncbi:primosomal protein N' [Campylobacter sp. RM13119]|uniref:primosomal protein N' n=1 Tax=Campylobacter TaxID=194 RepID=UPI001473A871|nr:MULTISPECIES: primosomal protein N' [unclassified Campylobacter]MBE3022597.1 primosomal protein N' [Campylobacter sp. 7477a]MBE3606317.1 primosomal protein N' [Campylobacter sp. RM13119]MBE3608994.1 primosomal protein N' [Campylobacter sp. RM12916]